MGHILVTGSSGLVGVPLVAALERAGHEVMRFDIRDGDGRRDIRDPLALAKAVAGCDGIVHLAAISRVAWGEAAPDLCHEVNVTGTAHVIAAAEAAPRRPWIVFASSREVYGTLRTVPAHEDAPFLAENVYGRSKLAGERLFAAPAKRGLRAAIVRLSNVYGGLNDHPDRAVPSLLSRAMRGEDMKITGAGAFFDFVHVDDCVTGLMAAMARLQAGEAAAPVHLVTGRATSLLELAELARAVAGSSSGLEVAPARSFDVQGFVGDPSRARAQLDWQAKVTLREGLERLCADLRAHGAPIPDVTMPPAAWPLAVAG